MGRGYARGKRGTGRHTGNNSNSMSGVTSESIRNGFPGATGHPTPSVGASRDQKTPEAGGCSPGCHTVPKGGGWIGWRYYHQYAAPVILLWLCLIVLGQRHVYTQGRFMHWVHGTIEELHAALRQRDLPNLAHLCSVIITILHRKIAKRGKSQSSLGDI